MESFSSAMPADGLTTYYGSLTKRLYYSTGDATNSTTAVSTIIVPYYNGTSHVNMIIVVFNIIIGCVGLIGNTFVIVVIVGMTSLYKQLANVFVINQSVIDAVSSLCVITQVASSMVVPPRLIDGQAASEVYCRLWQTQALMWALFTSSTYNLVALTLERYLKIVHPVIYKTSFTLRKAKAIVVCVWLFGIVYQFFIAIPTSAVVRGSCLLVGIWPSRRLQQAVGYSTVTIQYWIPICIFVFAYARMIRVLQRQRVGPLGNNNITLVSNATNFSNTVADNRTNISTTRSNLNTSLARAQRNLTKTVVMASVGFVFCWSWSQWYYPRYTAGLSLDFTDGFYEFAVVMISLHCCINPFIYIANYDQFRAAVHKIFTQWRHESSTSDTPASYPI